MVLRVVGLLSFSNSHPFVLLNNSFNYYLILFPIFNFSIPFEALAVRANTFAFPLDASGAIGRSLLSSVCQLVSEQFLIGCEVETHLKLEDV